VLGDSPREVRIGEEMLPERLLGPDPVAGGDLLQPAAPERRALTS
jgi:hypothetical protein